MSLSFPQQVQLADVSLTNGSLIQVPASDGSSTAINASTEDILGGINITARSVALTNGAVLIIGTEGQGNAGGVKINARDTLQLNNGEISTNATDNASPAFGAFGFESGML